MTNQYKAASELQSCIVPTDFRILCRNWPSAAAGWGWRMGSPVPPAWKHWAVQTQSWSLSGQQDPGCRCPEGPVYSNNSTRPSVWAEARRPPGARIPRQLPSVPYLPASQRWGGGGGNVLGTQPGPTDFKARVWCSDCTGTGPLTLAIWAPASKAQLKSPPLRSPLGVLASKCPVSGKPTNSKSEHRLACVPHLQPRWSEPVYFTPGSFLLQLVPVFWNLMNALQNQQFRF